MRKSLIITLPIAILSIGAISYGIISKIKGESLFKEIRTSKNEETKSNSSISSDSIDNEIRVDDDKIEDDTSLI